MSRFIRAAVLASLLCLPCAAAFAQTICVSSVPQLLSAMDQFRQAPEDATVTIKLVRGTYVIGASLSADGILPATDNVKLRVLGGYSAGCATRAIDPANTVFDGNNLANSGISMISPGDAGELLFEGIAFTRMRRPVDHFPGAVLSLQVNSGDNGIATVRYCRFSQNSASKMVLFESPQMRLVNNRITDNVLIGNLNPNMPSAAVEAFWSEPATDPVLFAANNTIANNSGAPGILIDGGAGNASDRLSEISNNIVWGNGSPQIDMGWVDHGSNVILFAGNVYGNIDNPPPTSSSNLAVDPQFVAPGIGDYNLQLLSPAVNSGVLIMLNATPAQDIDGGARIVGTNIDRGAYESAFDNRSSFIVTTTADNGNNNSPTAGSLRAAVKAANAAGVPYLIRFAIPGACPQMISLTAPMLDIVGDVRIDATTQAGWVENTSYGRMDGTLCLFINGNASATHAFRVPAGASSARLNVQGLILASFSDAAIRLEDGSGHRISGNQFGAVPFTSANGAAVRVTGASGGALIGGFDDVGAVNVIAGAADAGIYLDNTAGGSVVGNNVIGFQPNGMFAVGNSIGIFVFNSPANNLQYNFIGNSTSNGITLSGAASSGNILQHNTIGVGYELAPAANAGAGVGVIFAAHDNTIGAVLTGTGGGNQIVDNVGPGVWISNSGGGGNRVLANEMTGNGGIDIDLAALGASPNQPLNPDSGPNRMQNHPVLTSATRFQAIGTIRVTGGMHSAPSSTYRIDVYFDGNCDASSPSRGNALAWRGRGSMTTNASGDGSFILDVPAYPGVPSLGVVAATATSSTGDTSEISNCFAETSGTLVDLVFANGME